MCQTQWASPWGPVGEGVGGGVALLDWLTEAVLKGEAPLDSGLKDG